MDQTVLPARNQECGDPEPPLELSRQHSTQNDPISSALALGYRADEPAFARPGKPHGAPAGGPVVRSGELARPPTTLCGAACAWARDGPPLVSIAHPRTAHGG